MSNRIYPVKVRVPSKRYMHIALFGLLWIIIFISPWFYKVTLYTDYLHLWKKPKNWKISINLWIHYVILWAIPNLACPIRVNVSHVVPSWIGLCPLKMVTSYDSRSKCKITTQNQKDLIILIDAPISILFLDFDFFLTDLTFLLTAWNVSKYGVFLVHIFPHLDWIFGLYSVRMRENTDQKKLRIWTHFTQCPSKSHY